jgi:hypothetical protein
MVVQITTRCKIGRSEQRASERRVRPTDGSNRGQRMIQVTFQVVPGRLTTRLAPKRICQCRNWVVGQFETAARVDFGSTASSNATISSTFQT